MKTVTVGNAGKNLPGLKPLDTVEEELASHGSRSTAELFPEATRAAKHENLEQLGLFQQGQEAGLALLTGGQVPGKNIEKLVKSSPLTEGEHAGVKGAESAEKGIEAAADWTVELGKWLSPESLKRLGLIIAGSLLLIFAFFMIVHAMGGPTPIPVP